MAHPAREAREAVIAQHPEAVVVERKRNSIKHRIADSPRGQPRFVLDTGIGPMHFGTSEDQEIDTAWQPGIAPWDFEMTQAGYNAHALADFSSGQIVRYTHPRSGENIRFQPQQLQYTNDLDQIQAIANPQSVNAVVQDEDALFWQGAYGPGFDLRWQAQTARLDKRLIVDSAARFPAPQQFILDGGNPVLRFQFIFQVSNGMDIYVNDVLWTRGPNSRVDTQGYVEFRLNSTGEALWTFNLPRTFKNEQEEETSELLGTFRMRRQANSLFVEHRVPLIELRSATYPVQIDVTIDDQIGASGDDGRYSTDSPAPTATHYSKTFAQNNAGYFNDYAYYRLGSWLRFINISGLSGSTIDAAYISLYGAYDDLGTPLTKLSADDATAPSAPTSRNDANGRTLTTAQVDWDDPNIAAGSWSNSPSISSIIQELADSYDPSVIQIFWEDDGSGSSSYNFGLATSYNDSTSNAPKLHIEYTAGAGGGAILPWAQQHLSQMRRQ